MGESCGTCFNPDLNNDCGKCAKGLACKQVISDAAGECVKDTYLKGC